MENVRGGYTYKKQVSKQKGVALITVLVVSTFVLLALSGVYLVVTSLISTTQTIKTYTNVKEAATSGVEEGVLRIKSNEFTPNDCTQGKTLEYRVGNQTAQGRLSICFIGVGAGYQIGGASDTGSGDSGYMYRIISEVQDPQYGTKHRVEAIYTSK